MVWLIKGLVVQYITERGSALCPTPDEKNIEVTGVDTTKGFKSAFGQVKGFLKEGVLKELNEKLTGRTSMYPKDESIVIDFVRYANEKSTPFKLLGVKVGEATPEDLRKYSSIVHKFRMNPEFETACVAKDTDKLKQLVEEEIDRQVASFSGGRRNKRKTRKRTYRKRTIRKHN